MTKATAYSLSALTGVDFNLYPYEGIDIKSLEAVQAGFIEEYETEIKTRLLELGLKYNSIITYSPKYYNYEGDDLTLNIEIVDTDKIISAIFERFEDIQKELDKNVGYDGYIPTTANSTKDAIADIRAGNDCDVIALRVLLDIDFMFDMFEYVIYDEDEG